MPSPRALPPAPAAAHAEGPLLLETVARLLHANDTAPSRAFEAVKAAHDRLQDEGRREFCVRICSAAEDAVVRKVQSQKKKLRKEGDEAQKKKRSAPTASTARATRGSAMARGKRPK